MFFDYNNVTWNEFDEIFLNVKNTKEKKNVNISQFPKTKTKIKFFFF